MDNTRFLSHIEEALRAEPGSVTMADQLRNLEGWDSIGALSIIAVIDEQYGLTLDAGALLTSQTVGDLAALVAVGLAKAA